MTEKLYLESPYLKEIGAKVVSSDGTALVLDRTIFYPGGGGQPFDTGIIEIGGRAYNVIETKKQGDDVVHLLDRQPAALAGDAAHCRIDWARRYAIMRHHTAMHVIDAVIEATGRYNGHLTGGMMTPEKLHFDINMPDVTREIAARIIGEAQQYIDKGLEVRVRTLTREEALKIPNLSRTEPGRELLKRLNSVRIVEIEGLDFQMDGGTHVANTREIGKLELAKYENKGTNRKRLELRLVRQ